MSNSNFIKKTFKIFAVVVISVILLVLFYSVSIYLGWVSVPKVVTNSIAKSKGLDKQETAIVNSIPKIYQSIKKSDNAEELKEVQNLLVDEASSSQLWKYFLDNYSKISDKTLESIRQQMKIEENDFNTAKEVFERGLKAYNTNGAFYIDESDIKILLQLQIKYGITQELIDKLLN